MANQSKKKTKRIFRKIFLPMVMMLVLFAFVTSAFNYFSVDRFVKENAKVKIEEAYKDIEEQIHNYRVSGNKDFMLMPSENLVNQSNNTKVYVFDEDYKEVALFDNTIYLDSEMIEFLSELLLNYELEEDILTTIRIGGREYLANLYVASDDLNIREKYFVIVQDLTDKAVLLKENSRNMLIVQIIMLFLTLITVFIIARDLSKPLIKLSKESEEYVIGKGTTISDTTISTLELETLRTTLQKMQLKIDEESNRKNTIYENVAHDLRTPLVSILGYADGLKSGIIKDKNKACDVILRTGNQLKEMIENILVLSRFDNDTYKSNKEELSLVDLINEQVETVKVIDESKKVIFDNNVTDEAIILSDRKLLIRIIQNLLSNAIKYAKEKVTIKLSTAASEVVEANEVAGANEVVVAKLAVGANAGVGAKLREPSTRTGEFNEPLYQIVVSDDGEGIDEKNIENIFTRYYKGEDGHFGIGLAVVKSSVDYLGGEIKVESEKGKGTRFMVAI